MKTHIILIYVKINYYSKKIVIQVIKGNEKVNTNTMKINISVDIIHMI